MAERTNYVCQVSAEQAEQLRAILADRGWTIDSIPYAHYRAQKDKTTVAAYESGKLVVQGKGTAELVQFTLEPEILQEARFGYETELARQEQPEMFEPHAGIDESGKGDYFGPLVIAAVHVDGDTADALLHAGVTDSKAIKSDTRIAAMAEKIRDLLPERSSVVPIGPGAYNRLYEKMGSVNRLLAWGHARALENLLELCPDCPRAISDQFGRKDTVKKALLDKGRDIELVERTKAEADVAVAAASILARHEFVRRLQHLADDLGLDKLPKGASAAVRAAAARILREHGEEALAEVAKLHFRTTEQARQAQ